VRAFDISTCSSQQQVTQIYKKKTTSVANLLKEGASPHIRANIKYYLRPPFQPFRFGSDPLPTLSYALSVNKYSPPSTLLLYARRSKTVRRHS